MLSLCFTHNAIHCSFNIRNERRFVWTTYRFVLVLSHLNTNTVRNPKFFLRLPLTLLALLCFTHNVIHCSFNIRNERRFVWTTCRLSLQHNTVRNPKFFLKLPPSPIGLRGKREKALIVFPKTQRPLPGRKNREFLYFFDQ